MSTSPKQLLSFSVSLLWTTATLLSMMAAQGMAENKVENAQKAMEKCFGDFKDAKELGDCISKLYNGLNATYIQALLTMFSKEMKTIENAGIPIAEEQANVTLSDTTKAELEELMNKYVVDYKNSYTLDDLMEDARKYFTEEQLNDVWPGVENGMRYIKSTFVGLIHEFATDHKDKLN